VKRGRGTIITNRPSSHDTHPENVQLLVAAARSLPLRVRYVTALQPMDTKLTIDHALFSSNTTNNDTNVPNVLRQLMQTCDTTKTPRRRMRKGVRHGIQKRHNDDEPKQTTPQEIQEGTGYEGSRWRKRTQRIIC